MGLFIAILLILITTIYIWVKNKHSYWKRRQVETVSFREFYGKKKRHVAFIIQDAYNKMKTENRSYVGAYNLITPTLVIRDLDLLKTIFITDFETFPDRGMYSNPHHDPLSANLVRLTGDVWKKMRIKMTPTFTTGKMKMMFPTVAGIGEGFIRVFGEQVENKDSQLEVRDLCARFTTDVIGSVAFGLDCNSLREPQTEFRVKGDKAFWTSHPLVDSLSSSYPKFFQFLGYKAFTKELIDFYSKIVRQNVEVREKLNIKRNDFLDILINLKNSKDENGEFYMQMQDIIAQAFVFFIGGFETSSSTMSFALYELAMNPEVQERARQNVKEVLEEYEGSLSYESLNKMHYIKQLVQETLRKHPVGPTNKRVCRSTFTLPCGLTLQPGVDILIPVYSIHHDPDIYHEPETFDPERFSSDNQNQRHSMSFLAFGAGPRVCIAERFGIMQVMTGVALLLKHFKFSPCKKTPKCLEFDPSNSRILSVKNGIYLKIERV